MFSVSICYTLWLFVITSPRLCSSAIVNFLWEKYYQKTNKNNLPKLTFTPKEQKSCYQSKANIFRTMGIGLTFTCTLILVMVNCIWLAFPVHRAMEQLACTSTALQWIELILHAHRSHHHSFKIEIEPHSTHLHLQQSRNFLYALDGVSITPYTVQSVIRQALARRTHNMWLRIVHMIHHHDCDVNWRRNY